MEKLKTPEDFIPAVLHRVKKDYLCRMYKLTDWKDTADFLDQVCRRTGRLLKHGEPDINAVSKMILNDWQRGKLPFFVPPPNPDEPKKEETTAESTAATEEVVQASAPVEQEDAGTTDKKKKFEPRLAQDFSKIRVDLKYDGDDVRPLEAQPELADLEQSGDEEEEDEPEDTPQPSTAQPSTAEEEEDDEDWSDEEEEVTRPPPEESDDDDGKRKDKKLQLKSRTITKNGFTVTPTGANPRSKLTSKERRKADRDAKKKKVGAHFYEVVNVKNKSKKKGFLEMAKAFRGHCKK